MFSTWIKLSLLLSGVRAFLVQNTQCSLCLEDSAGEVLLKKCNLDSMNQQWVWTTQGKLMCVATSRCLSAQPDPVRTSSCHSSTPESERLLWDCDRDRLISRITSMILSVDGQHVILADRSKQSKWRSVDQGDICQERLRLRRASDDPDESQDVEGRAGEGAVMTEEQREYLRWYYRTEDPTMWKFVLLGLSFICLLIGFLLLGMGAMANKSRKKIAHYKAAASLVKKSGNEEIPLRDGCNSNGEVNELGAGDIVITWKDGNTSSLFSDPAPQLEELEEQEEPLKEELEKEVVSAELSSSYEVMAIQ